MKMKIDDLLMALMKRALAAELGWPNLPLFLRETGRESVNGE